MAPKNEIWISVSVDYTSHPKVTEAGSDGGMMNIGAIGYARKFLTDGFVPASAVAGLAPTVKRPAATVKLLVASGLWVKVDGGYRVHDYEQWNQTKAIVKKQRDGWKDEKRAQRERSLSGPDTIPDKDTDKYPDSHASAGRAHSASSSSSGGVGLEGGAGETAKPWRQSLVPGPHRSHGWCTDRGLCLPQVLYDELLGRLGGPEHAQKLRDWLGLNIAALGSTVPGENVWTFWRSRFELWQGKSAVTYDAKPRPELGSWRDECDRVHGGKNGDFCTNSVMHHARMHAAECDQVSA